MRREKNGHKKEKNRPNEILKKYLNTVREKIPHLSYFSRNAHLKHRRTCGDSEKKIHFRTSFRDPNFGSDYFKVELTVGVLFGVFLGTEFALM